MRHIASFITHYGTLFFYNHMVSYILYHEPIMGVYPVLQPRICHDRQRRSALNPGPDLKTHSNIRPRSAAEDCFGFIAR
ncbi:Uncharacterized protein HZ326_11769 [Fusarium oxysporum f. sp. albedinis]|nr:Uncharacterized protein HZ326_11769 [Fusarium oxysporum f. sp. albedinis]